MTDSSRPDRRIAHVEDLMFWDGAQGLIDSVQALLNPENYQSCNIKWDGSPAIVFGRDLQGRFILTDKHGFASKSRDDRPETPDQLSNMILSRRPEHTPSRLAYAKKMKMLFAATHAIIPEEYRGFIKADLMYANPQSAGQHYIFQPNTVKYYVSTGSSLGQHIGQSDFGISCHDEIDNNTNLISTLGQPGSLMNRVFAFAPTYVKDPPRNLNKYNYVQEILVDNEKYNALDDFLSIENHQANQISDLGTLMYRYVNKNVGMNPVKLGNDFEQWLRDQGNVSDSKKSRIFSYIEYHRPGYELAWDMYGQVAQIKNNIISDLEKQQLVPGMKTFVAGKPGSEGYVMDTAEAGQIKLVNRGLFTLANQDG